MIPLANIFQPLIDVFDAVIVFFHDTVGLSWGLSIIALTVTVRFVLLPLAFKQFHSMQALARHAPELKALQTKYKDDKQRLQQETMRFYQENKINPLGSCLPLVAQLPVFLSLFYMLRQDLRVDICSQVAKPCGDVARGSAEFGFIPDLTDKATGGVLIALILLYVGTQLFSSVLMSTTTDRTQQTIIIALPIVFVPFIISFPTGLLVYWITTNVWTIGQQWIIRRSAGYGGWAANKLPDHLKPAPAAAGARALTDGKTRRPAAEKGAAPASDGERRRATPPPPPRRSKKKKTGRRR